VEASRLRYKQFVEDNRRDSASEPDDEFPGQYSTVSLGPLQEESIVRREDCELIQLIVTFLVCIEEEKWEKLFDKAKKMHYWINYATNSITYDEPSQPFEHEHGFLGKIIKVFWIVQV